MRYRYGLPPDEQLKAIGMVTAQWQRLESIVNFGIWSLSGTAQNVAEAITAHLNLHTRLDICKLSIGLETKIEIRMKS
jgi:hypothetical protein